MQPRDLLVAGLPLFKPFARPLDGLRDKFLRLFCHRRGQPARCSGLDRPADLAVVSVEHRLQGIGTVAQEMPTVGDLERLRCALPDAVGIGASPIAGHDLDRGIPLQPGGKVTRPCRGATLVGNCLQALAAIDAVGNDFWMKTGICGKGGQKVPVGTGQGHVRIASMTVGGTQA